MEESYYRIEVKLREPNYITKRRDLLRKVDFLERKLKEKGHSGRYGLKGLYCFAPMPTFAYCLTSIEHETDFPWLKKTIYTIQDEESERREKQHDLIDNTIVNFNGVQDDEAKREFLKTIKYGDLGIKKENTTIDNLVQELNRIKAERATFSADDFTAEELFIKPFKPTKRELDIEEQYVGSFDEQEKTRINAKIRNRLESDITSKKTARPLHPGELEAARKRFRDLANKNKK